MNDLVLVLLTLGRRRGRSRAWADRRRGGSPSHLVSRSWSFSHTFCTMCDFITKSSVIQPLKETHRLILYWENLSWKIEIVTIPAEVPRSWHPHRSLLYLKRRRIKPYVLGMNMSFAPHYFQGKYQEQVHNEVHRSLPKSYLHSR